MHEPDVSDELRLVEAEVDRFCARSIEPHAARPEAPMSPEEVRAILAEATEIGLVAGEAHGAGMWDDADEGPRRTIGTLVRVARTNAGVAWAAHVASLAQVVARRLSAPAAGVGAIVVEGHHGIGRDALARFLARTELDEGDDALLADVYGLEGPRLASLPHRFDWLIVPFVAEGHVHWSRSTRETARVEPRPHAHGLDEIATACVRASPVAGVTRLDDREARALFVAALGATSLAAMAVALGATEHAIAIARDYARLRRQGGVVIARHAAVRALLGRARAVTESVGASLARAAEAPIDAASLPRILSLRSEAQPALCRAANDAMQVLGGVGYMRDVGVEKIVRDVNHLRVTCGSPAELRLVVGEWSRHVA